MSTLEQKQRERLVDISYSTTPSIPKELYLELNNTCNHKCFFCSNEKMTRKKDFLDEKLAERLMEEAYELGVKDITFFATGEPFLVSRLDTYIKYAKDIGYEYIFLTTNGALANPKVAKKVIDAGLNSVKFSINAGTRESYKKVHGKDEFDKVIDNVKWFYDYKIANNIDLKIYCSMVPTIHNKEEYDALMSKVGSFLSDAIHKRECSNQGGNMLENNEITIINPDNILGTLRSNQVSDRKICPDPFNRLVISSEGYMTACVVDYQNALIIADLNHSTIKEAWHNEKYRELREKHLKNNLEGTICYNCLYNKNETFLPLSKEFFRPFKSQKDMDKYK